MRSRLGAVLVAWVLAACGDARPTESHADPTTELWPAARTGNDECDLIIASYRACLDHAPPQARDQLSDNLESNFDYWLEMAQLDRSDKHATKILPSICSEALVAWRRTSAAMKCELPPLPRVDSVAD